MARKPSTVKKAAAKPKTETRGRPSSIKGQPKLKPYVIKTTTLKGKSTLAWNTKKYLIQLQGPKTTPTITHIIVKSRRTKEVVFNGTFKKGGGDKATKYNGGQPRKKSVRNTSQQAVRTEQTQKRLNAGITKTAAKKTGAKTAAKKTAAKKTGAKKSRDKSMT